MKAKAAWLTIFHQPLSDGATYLKNGAVAAVQLNRFPFERDPLRETQGQSGYPQYSSNIRCMVSGSDVLLREIESRAREVFSATSLSLAPPSARRRVGTALGRLEDPQLGNEQLATSIQEIVVGGRSYRLQLRQVGTRWRAQVTSSHGIPTALMPFYGQTANEAANHLTAWLTRAYHRTLEIRRQDQVD